MLDTRAETRQTELCILWNCVIGSTRDRKTSAEFVTRILISIRFDPDRGHAKHGIMIRDKFIAKYSAIVDTNSRQEKLGACRSVALNNSVRVPAIFLLSSFPVKLSSSPAVRLIFDPQCFHTSHNIVPPCFISRFYPCVPLFALG